ncbi:MAG TPA: amino acid adenylation domain-containing protein, partial [Puia sp.]|uniref:non-ribosomal peptide synthetase n=1 Tax=Puia sp. TaxID=2045100 RepID=UPI002C5FD3E4
QYNSLNEIQQWAGIQGDLFDTLMVFENYPVSKVLASRKWSLEVGDIEMHDQANYPLDISITVADKTDVQFSYNMELLDVHYADMIARQFEYVLRQMVDGEAVLLKDLRLISDEEGRRLLTGFNAGWKDWIDERTITALFEEQAAATPEATAILFEEERLTYRQLDERSNQLGHYLRRIGVGCEVPVLVCMERSAGMIVALLAVLKAGGCYVPVDPDYPADRIRVIMDDVRCGIVLTEETARSRLPADEKTVMTIQPDKDREKISVEPTGPLPAVHTGEHVAYILYTSGSTGVPKGVVIEHRSLAEYARYFAEYFSIGAEDAILQQSSVSFDTMVEEVYPALISGARLVVLRDSGKDLFAMKAYIEEGLITLLSTTPLVIDWLNRELTHKGNLRCVISGGDVLWPAYISNLFPQVALFNTYGPTEATVCATYHRIGDIADASLIGAPAANKRVCILGRDGRPAALGVTGEICISGNGVARGYLNAPDQTAEKFGTDVSWLRPGERMYRTGDRGRWLPDGRLEFGGRLDDQVKIRGHRIEPAEIESVLLGSGMVNRAVVVARKDRDGINRLVGYIVPNPSFDREGLADHLSRKLPTQMLLSALVEMESLPLTISGKIDKRALPADAENILRRRYVAPESETEQFLADVWQNLLGVARVGLLDNFFELGGHSLLATRVISAIKKKYSLAIPIRVIFELNNINDLSKYLELQIDNDAEVQKDPGTYKLITI